MNLYVKFFLFLADKKNTYNNKEVNLALYIFVHFSKK